ncbi:hypothetical protein KORDIASMS9_01187 [Kordia sp. SMS9]|uniref:hypothetical protein n=1 Tax=Kordia sp. SMS9 TaxID=2282170 RepID=UPI000E10381A|nr:hypothetical protein [Kordia sp. SMS9]AXG68968.1 hypothetical protein KORDIASMS9_01187 [Kordia sp. SMS9]
MKSKIAKIISSKSILIFAILLFASNFVSKLCKEVFSMNASFYPSTILKILAVFVLGIYFVMFLRKDTLAKYVYILVGVFLVDVLIKVFHQEAFSVIMSKGYFFSKLIFFFLLAIAIKDVKKEHLEKTINALFLIAKINLIFIVIGFLFKIDIFKSYPYTDRFGFNGIISEPGISSYFYMLLAIIAYMKYIYKKGSLINLLLICIGVFFLGTKSGLLFLAILVFIHILILLKKNIYRLSFVAVLVTSFLILKDTIITLAINSFSFGPYIYEKHGLLTFITSKRDLLFIDAMTYIKEEWNVLNYVIGGIDLKMHRVEFEFVDIFLFLGITGLLVYIFILKKVFFQKKQDWLYSVLFLTIILISSLGGNLFFSITNAFCFAVVFMYLRDINTAEEKQL